jgi:hypothetical protein
MERERYRNREIDREKKITKERETRMFKITIRAS